MAEATRCGADTGVARCGRTTGACCTRGRAVRPPSDYGRYREQPRFARPYGCRVAFPHHHLRTHGGRAHPKQPHPLRLPARLSVECALGRWVVRPARGGGGGHLAHRSPRTRVAPARRRHCPSTHTLFPPHRGSRCGPKNGPTQLALLRTSGDGGVGSAHAARHARNRAVCRYRPFQTGERPLRTHGG